MNGIKEEMDNNWRRVSEGKTNLLLLEGDGCSGGFVVQVDKNPTINAMDKTISYMGIGKEVSELLSGL